MLQALRKHDSEEAQKILSSLTSELLPNPEVGTRLVGSSIDSTLHSEIWQEIRRRTKLDPFNTAPDMRARLFEFLVNEMTQAALPESTLRSVKTRLSRKGELRKDLYDVTFSPAFQVSSAHGVRRNHVLEGVKNADDVEHLEMLDGDVLLSFFLRIHNDPDPRDRFALLISGQRLGHELEVGVASRIYQSDVDFSAAQKPTDILRAFVNKYGFMITIGHITAKLILDETTTLEAPVDADNMVKVHALEGASIYSDFLLRTRTLHNSYGIAIAFALDEEKYATDLRKHGVEVDSGGYRSPQLYKRPVVR